MPRKCSVPGCKSNYNPNADHITTFRFPKDEQLCKTWISKINRKDFVPGSCACVCILHFDERFITRDDKATRADGTLLTLQRKVPLLPKDAYPTIFNGQPKYLSCPLPSKRKTPEDRTRELKERCEINFKKLCAADNIDSFSEFLKLCSIHLLKCIRNNWLKQTETNQTFNIPSFDDTDNKLYYASILHLKKLYNIEQHHSLKLAPALSKKVLYPTSLERQNVSTAIKLFDEKSVAALNIELKENKTGYGEAVEGKNIS
ncbi:THAP domain-containing protein 2, partial [Stegodyphus mimosarum]